MAEPVNRNLVFARALISELVRSGVGHLCLCPGSRSAPLVLAAADVAEESGALRLWTHLDERAAAFFAIGLARATRAPVALVATSGTAGANFLPAVVEAHHGRVPLVVLTADRPPELRDRGAGQTIDQIRLFGAHVRDFVEVGTPEPGAAMLRYARSVACRAVARSLDPPRGPVHLNLPFREPLDRRPADSVAIAELDELARDGRPDATPFTRVHRAPRLADRATVDALVDRLGAARRGALLVGPVDAGDDEARALARAAVRLARATGWPLLADALSGIVRGPHLGDAEGLVMPRAFDALLRSERFASAARPDLLLRVGDSFTSKALRLWRERHPQAHEVLIDPDGVWHDPSALVAELVRAEPAPLLEELARRLEAAPDGAATDPAWRRAWSAAADGVATALREALPAGDAGSALTEPRVVAALDRSLPAGATLFASSSMPVRDVDAFLEASTRPLRVVAQRGANGIDGVTSAALGFAAGSTGPTVLLTGDLAFLHDVGGLLAARRHAIDAVLVVVDNDGGGIFSYLPIAASEDPDRFRRHFETPHGLDLAGAARLYGLEYAAPGTDRELGEALRSALARRGASLVHVVVDRERSVAHHRAVWNAVDEAIERVGGVA